MSGYDAMQLYIETRNQSSNMMSIMRVDTASVSDIPAAIVQQLRRRMHLTPVLQYRLHSPWYNIDRPLWRLDPTDDPADHVYQGPTCSSTSDIAAACTEIYRKKLARNKPLWELWILPVLGDENEAVLVLKIHHALMDANSGKQMLDSLTEREIPACPSTPIHFGKPVDDNWRALTCEALTSKLNRALRLPFLLTTMLSTSWKKRRRSGVGTTTRRKAPKTTLNSTLTRERVIAVGELELEAIRLAADLYRSTVNDVLLSCLGGALRTELESRGDKVTDSMVAAVPIAGPAQSGQDTSAGAISTAIVYMPVRNDISDPADRLSAITSETAEIKNRHRGTGFNSLREFAEYLIGPLLNLSIQGSERFKIADRVPPACNMVVSNHQSSGIASYFLAMPVVAEYQFGPLTHGTGINVSASSRFEKMSIGIAACPRQLKDPAEVITNVGRELRALLDSARREQQGTTSNAIRETPTG